MECTTCHLKQKLNSCPSNNYWYLHILLESTNAEKLKLLIFQDAIEQAYNLLKGIAKGGPGVPVTPPFASLFGQTAYSRCRKCHDDTLAIVTIW